MNWKLIFVQKFHQNINSLLILTDMSVFRLRKMFLHSYTKKIRLIDIRVNLFSLNHQILFNCDQNCKPMQTYASDLWSGLSTGHTIFDWSAVLSFMMMNLRLERDFAATVINWIFGQIDDWKQSAMICKLRWH